MRRNLLRLLTSLLRRHRCFRNGLKTTPSDYFVLFDDIVLK